MRFCLLDSAFIAFGDDPADGAIDEISEKEESANSEAGSNNCGDEMLQSTNALAGITELASESGIGDLGDKSIHFGLRNEFIDVDVENVQAKDIADDCNEGHGTDDYGEANNSIRNLLLGILKLIFVTRGTYPGYTAEEDLKDKPNTTANCKEANDSANDLQKLVVGSRNTSQAITIRTYAFD